MPYLGYYAQSFRGLPTDSYWDFWRHYILSGFTKLTCPVVFTTHPGFHHQHYYFLASLLEISAVFLVLHALWTRFGASRESADLTGNKPNFTGGFLLLTLGIPLAHFLAANLSSSAMVIAFFFYFQLGDLALFGGAFALGIYAYDRRDATSPWPCLEPR